MGSLIQEMHRRGDLNCAKWIPDSVVYEVITGSQSYGIATPESDWDICGVVIPPIAQIFPHLDGHVEGFGPRSNSFTTHQIGKYQLEGREYETTIYGLVKYFALLADCNPNIIDTLFVRGEMVKAITQVGTLLRENRKLFLHKKAWHTFKGYAYNQLAGVGKMPTAESTRRPSWDKFGFDVKYAYNVVRLLLEVEMILIEGDLDLMRHKEQLRAIRNGDWSASDIKEWAAAKEKDLESVYVSSSLPHTADWPKLRRLLLQCIEAHYGSLDKFSVVVPGADRAVLQQIAAILDTVGL